jgi:hypothetical protein
VGSHTIHQFQFVDDNAPALPQGDLANVSLQNRRPYPQWGILGTWAPLGWARYNAGTLSLKNNQWHGLTLQSNLSWAKNISSSRIGTSDQGNINFRVPYIWSGPSAITPYWWFINALNYNTPKLEVARVLRPVVDDWVFTATYTAATGSPETVSGQDLTGTGYTASSSLVLPNRICNPNSGSNIHSQLQWFNTSCFANAAFGVWGNSALGAVTDPGVNNWNIATAKRIPLGFLREGHALEFRADFFNAWNHTQWLSSDKSMTSATYGRITSTHPARQVQFALRYLF